MIHWSEFLNWTNFAMMLPVILAGLYLMPLLYRGIVNAVMPWKEVNAVADNRWNGVDRRQKMSRRNQERMAEAREACRRGDPEAAHLIGRRKSDYGVLGLDLPKADAQS